MLNSSIPPTVALPKIHRSFQSGPRVALIRRWPLDAQPRLGKEYDPECFGRARRAPSLEAGSAYAACEEGRCRNGGRWGGR